jgi:hypothetical protein
MQPGILRMLFGTVPNKMRNEFDREGTRKFDEVSWLMISMLLFAKWP